MASERLEISVQGICRVCGKSVRFVDDHKSIRESFKCESCKASLRYRHQAEIINSLYSRKASPSFKDLCSEEGFRTLRIYEPGIIGPFRRYLQSIEGYQNSYCWNNVEPGQNNDGIRCENMEHLTFADNSFDLIITSDILEHVRFPNLAFRECFRVLKKGGYHVFTVPFLWPLSEESVKRVDTSKEEDVFILPNHYHGNPVDPEGSLVYTDLGLDIVEMMEAVGFKVSLACNYLYNITVIALKI